MSAAAIRTGALALALGLALAACQGAQAPEAAAPAAPAAAPPAAQDTVGTGAAAPPAASAAPAAATPTAPERVVPVALGEVAGVRVGQAFAELKGLGEWKSHGMTELIGEGCEYYDGGPLPPSISMMVYNDKVARFDLGQSESDLPQAQAGPFGLRVGMTRDQAMALFPSPPESSPHAYDGDQGEYLTWRQPGTTLGLRLELSQGKVTQMYWGNGEEIELIEGCA